MYPKQWPFLGNHTVHLLLPGLLRAAMATSQRVPGFSLFPAPANLRDCTKCRQVFTAAEEHQGGLKEELGMGMKQAEVF